MLLLHSLFLLFVTISVRCEAQQKNEASKPEDASKETLRGNLQQAMPIYAGLPIQLEQQLQYPQYPGFGYVQQKQYPRVQPQPQILIYGASGQGQPILFGTGSPPGNFLIPQPGQQGPNVLVRGSPQRPIFVAGYPKPAHIPPIEKDAEEVPTNPARIPPLASRTGPEKLETFNEGKTNDKPTQEKDQRPIPGGTDSLNPGQRFFILNGEPLFQNYQYLDNLPGYPSQDQQQNQQLQEYLYRNQQDQGQLQDQNQLRYQQDQVRYKPEQLLRTAVPNYAFNEELSPLFGQFRYQAPNDPYFPIGGDDVENDSIVVDAEDDNKGRRGEKSEGDQDSPPSGPSTAQASPGAVALAGPGGVAGAAPRATALVGKGGLAVSSPQATAVAGTKREKEDEKATSSREFVLRFRE